jgi:hypothetical protein
MSDEAIGEMGKMLKVAIESFAAPNEANGKMGNSPNEASAGVGDLCRACRAPRHISPNEAIFPRAERSQFADPVGELRSAGGG